MGKIIHFPKVYQENNKQDLEQQYKDYYSNPENYVVDSHEYIKGIDYDIVEGRIINLW